GTDTAIAAYGADRDARTRELFDLTDRIASFEWALNDVRALHKRLSRAMTEEVAALEALAPLRTEANPSVGAVPGFEADRSRPGPRPARNRSGKTRTTRPNQAVQPDCGSPGMS